VKLVLERLQLADTFTIGSLSVDGVFECWTLEDVVRDSAPKVFGKTAIPYGVYEVNVTYSPRFNRFMPILLSVPGFSGIRIHPGNYATDTEGCILVGLDRRTGMVGRSRDALNDLLPKLQTAIDNNDLITIEITKPQPGEVVA